MDLLTSFSPATRAWFTQSFTSPTPAQLGAWEAISSGQHTLVVAPTGSGKTLAAFLWAIDQLTTRPLPAERTHRCRVLYISPLKALAADVERNLRAPLVGIGHAAKRLDMPAPAIEVAMRSGDTPVDERQRFRRHPSDILITTPESLFLMLTSGAREVLRGIETVIIDEVHAVAGTKRGTHLAVTLDRLDALLPRAAQRIGLSATVRPVDEVGRYLAGGRPVSIVQPSSDKAWKLQVVVPVADLTTLGPAPDPLDLPGQSPAGSLWPHVEAKVVELIRAHRSTIVFCNSRRLAERITARINEIHEGGVAPATTPAAAPGQSGRAAGAPSVLARAHHGSVSREQRSQVEDDLKSGRLPAVVATSSLELGIDMGVVDLVIQVESPPSVASGLQRIGRAGHHVGATSHGVFFPKFRGDLLSCAVVTERMQAGHIEPIRVPIHPLDVLAQQLVAACALDDWRVDDLHALVQRSASFRTLTRPVLESVLDMLTGRYPSDDFPELRARLTWDRSSDTVSGRRSAQHLAVTSGGTIPDRGLYGVYLASGSGPGRRVGELDEEMVYESRIGDLFTLGTSTWRIEDISHDRVLVSPAPGQAGRLPFWKGDTLGRPADLGAAHGTFVRELARASHDDAQQRLARAGLDAWASDNLLAYLSDQRAATGRLPTDKTIIVERFRDEIGDWRVVIHSPFGALVHMPWSLAISARLRERYGVDVRAMAADDGIVLQLPDVEDDFADLLDHVLLAPEQVEELVTEQLGGSALFAARFRECAARALLLPRRDPRRRQALWQQRLRSAQLLEVAAQYPTFPIVLETVRECLQDVFDVPALVALLTDIAARRVTVVHVTTAKPSPFATSLLFGYVAQHLYEGDSPLAERRAAALSLDPALLSDLLGRNESLSLRELLDPDEIARTHAQLQHLTPERHARDAEDVLDLLRALGPLSEEAIAERVRPDQAGELTHWLEHLQRSRQVVIVHLAGRASWSAMEDAATMRDALGCVLPPGVPQVFLEPVADPLTDLVLRYARTSGPFRTDDVARRWGLPQAVLGPVIAALVSSKRLAEGEFLPGAHGGLELCDVEVLRILRRRSLATLRAEVEPVEPSTLGRFLPTWQGVGGHRRGTAGLLRAIEQLNGAVLPASAIETLILPARVPDYTPAMLDELTSSGEVLWCGHGSMSRDDGWISLHTSDIAPFTLPLIDETTELNDLHRDILHTLEGGGGYFFRQLASLVEGADDEALTGALWELVWAGRLGNDTLAPLRALLSSGRTAHRSAARGPRSTRYAGRPLRQTRSTSPAPSSPALAGRWTLLPERETNLTQRSVAALDVMLDRHGVLTRGATVMEHFPGGFGAAYRVLSSAEEQGQVRRGYFVESLGAAQFASTGAIDQLRATREDTTVLLAAGDPANPYGAALSWPARVEQTGEQPEPARIRRGHQPGRKAGAVVVLDQGELVLYVERGGRTVLSWSQDRAQLARAADVLAATEQRGALGRLTVERTDGEAVHGSQGLLVDALAGAGFLLTPKGLRRRPVNRS